MACFATCVWIIGSFFFIALADGDVGTRPRGKLAVHSDEYIRHVTSDLSEALSSSLLSRRARARVADIMALIQLPQQLYFLSADEIQSPITCRLCKTVGNVIIKHFREDNSTTGEKGLLYDLVSQLCVNANIMPEEVCSGVVHSNGPFFTYLSKNTPELTGEYACGVMLPECYTNGSPLDWSVDLSFAGPKPSTGTSNDTITDYHWDAKYVAGSNVECSLPTCCRNASDTPTSAEDAAGKWGDYRKCDVSWATVEELHNHTKEDLDEIDLIYFTGDILDHGIWETSRAGNEKLIRQTMAAMKDAFGDKMVLPIVGNHEPHPLNVFAPYNIEDEEISSTWLYEILADVWTQWLPKETRETIMRGAFYTVLIHPGFRVVALNTMYCYRMNWWLLHSPVDPSGQLAWLIQVLLGAEAAGEKVHILSHIPSGSSDCLEVWSREYARIVDRFSDTITAQFNGHTHKEGMKIFYGEDGRPNNVAFNGGSLTTYKNVNPNYKIYLVDGAGAKPTWQVMDAELWGFNITAANLHPEERPEWYQMYSFKTTYGVKSMHPTDLEELLERMVTNTTLQQLYYRNQMLQSDTATDCNSGCADSMICNTVTTVARHEEHCVKFQQIKLSQENA